VTAPAELADATLLVVDDDRDTREITAYLLERAGYRCRRAGSGPECLAIVAAESIDLILLDVMMPDMDGFAVCTALHERGCHVPIILLTARDDRDTRLEGMHHGVAEFLTKPINRVELYARVRAQLHILQLGRQLERVEAKLGGANAPRPADGR
jgi:DNA-binding response OmpR family regulator